MNMIDIKTNEAAIFSLYLNTRLMYGDKRYIEIIFLTVHIYLYIQLSVYFNCKTRTTNVVRNAGCARSRYTQNFF